MHARRFIGSVLVTALASASALVAVTATTADAAATYATRIVSGSSTHGVIYDSSYKTQPGAAVYGDSLSLSIGVQANVNGTWTDIYHGSLTVTRTIGAATAVVGTTADQAYLFASTRAVGSATYTISYTGYTDQYTGDVYQPATLGGPIAVQRKITTDVKSGHKATFHGKIKPRVAKALIQIKKSKHGKWKKFKKVRVTKRGAWSVKVSGPRKGAWYYRVVIRGGHGFATSSTAPTGIHRIY